jgi:hypothetical protein
MIIVKLAGGLGNQMFQYAVGRRLAIRNNTDLVLDPSYLAIDAKRKFELDSFKIKSRLANNQDFRVFHIPRNIALRRLIEKMNYFGRRRSLKIYKEKDPMKFERDILNLSGQVYLDGYWQSEGYFKDVSMELREDFSLISPTQHFLELADKIRSCDSVSIHFRRGDYISDQKMADFYGLLGEYFYGKAIGMILKKIKKPTFFMFSDDIKWVKGHFKTEGGVVYVEDKSLTNAEELILMGGCKNNIIANSSFSWWGAWLNRNPEKIVIAPQRWFNNAEVEVKDRFPSDWLII